MDRTDSGMFFVYTFHYRSRRSSSLLVVKSGRHGPFGGLNGDLALNELSLELAGEGFYVDAEFGQAFDRLIFQYWADVLSTDATIGDRVKREFFPFEQSVSRKEVCNAAACSTSFVHSVDHDFHVIARSLIFLWSELIRAGSFQIS